MSLLFFSSFEPRKQNSFTSLVFWRQQKSQRRMLLTLNKQKIVCKARYHYSKWEKPGEFAWTSYYSKSYKTKKVRKTGCTDWDTKAEGKHKLSGNRKLLGQKDSRKNRTSAEQLKEEMSQRQRDRDTEWESAQIAGAVQHVSCQW